MNHTPSRCSAEQPNSAGADGVICYLRWLSSAALGGSLYLTSGAALGSGGVAGRGLSPDDPVREAVVHAPSRAKHGLEPAAAGRCVI